MLQVLDELEKQGYVPDVTILLQATCPLRDAKQIDEAFEIFLKGHCDSVFAVKKIGTTHARWKMHYDGTLESLYNFRERPRRQDTDRHYPLLQETGSIYIIKTNVMKKVKDFIGENPKFYISPQSIDIDTIDDFKTVEALEHALDQQCREGKQPGRKFLFSAEFVFQ